jgi:hypothetical protein
MPYVPKNRITTSLYTPGGEFTLLTTRESYTGYYHRYYTGELFTGKSPDDQFVEQLVEFIQTEEENNSSESQIAIFPEDPDPLVDKDNWNPGLNSTYTYLKTGSTTPVQKQKLPSLYRYTPTDQDYNLGEITRYFTKKTNELKYIEVSKETYENFLNQQAGYAWEYYIAFNLPWQISGNKKEVETTNRNITQLTQKRLKIQGLPEFLKYDYLKFYK